jgi:hypothetical protein
MVKKQEKDIEKREYNKERLRDLHIRVSDREYFLVKKAAEKNSKSLSEYAREILFKKVVK